MLLEELAKKLCGLSEPGQVFVTPLWPCVPGQALHEACMQRCSCEHVAEWIATWQCPAWRLPKQAVAYIYLVVGPSWGHTHLSQEC